MKLRPIRISLYLFLLSFAGFSCTDSATDGDSGPAVVEGRVESVSPAESETAQAQDVEGAVVTAAQISSDGSLETIGGAEAETDAQGEYALEIPGEEISGVEAASRIVIVAQSEEGTGKTFVTSDVQSGSTVQAKPVTNESTAEANILQEVVANGEDGIVTNADIELAVQSEVAASLEANPDLASDIAILLGDQAEIKSAFYAREGVEVSTEQQEEIDQIKTDAQVELENRLNDLEDAPEEQEEAFTNFLETMANADLEAGVEASAAAQASELASRLVMNVDMELSGEAVSEIYKNNKYKSAVTLNNAVLNQLEAIGADESTISIAEDAGSTLQSDIRAATNATADEINSLFVEYNDKIVTGMESDATIEGGTFVTVNNIIGGEGGAKAAFESAVDGITDPDIIVNAYSDFFASVNTTVNSSFTETEGESAEAYAELLVLLNLAS